MASQRSRFLVLLGVVSAVALACGGQQSSQVTAEMFGYCGHRNIPWSEPDCPDTTASFANMQDIESMQLVMQTKSGTRRVVNIPANMDVIFLSKMSVDSILIPYYQGRNGTAQVQMLRNRMQRP